MKKLSFVLSILSICILFVLVSCEKQNLNDYKPINETLNTTTPNNVEVSQTTNFLDTPYTKTIPANGFADTPYTKKASGNGLLDTPYTKIIADTPYTKR